MCPRPQYTDLIYIKGTTVCGSLRIIFGSPIQSQHTILNIKFCVKRTLHVPKTPVHRFDLYRRYPILRINGDNFRQFHLELAYNAKYQICPRPQYTDLTCMGGTGGCRPIKIILGNHIQSQYASPNNKFAVNRMFHVLNTPISQFDLYGRYGSL